MLTLEEIKQTDIYNHYDMYKFNFEEELPNKSKEIIHTIENMIKNKEIPPTYPKYMIDCCGIDCIQRRHSFIEQIGFVLLSWDWIDYLVQYIGNKKCLEVMAGTGAFSYALKQKNINIIATDNFSWNKGNTTSKFKEYWTEIENIDAIESIKKYGKDIDIIIMSWAYMDDTAYNVLMEMRKVNPKCEMIFIGESEGGCTADDKFFESINEIENNNFIDKANENFHRWNGIHDYIRLCK